MQLGNIGKMTLINGDLHVELDVTIGGTPEAPLSADVKIGEVLTLLEAGVTNQAAKMGLALVITLLNSVNVQAKEV